MSKLYAKIGLGLVALVFVFALVSFLRENWGADAKPGPVERFVAEWVLDWSRPAESEVRNPFPPTEKNLQEGRLDYEKQCAFCHGLEGAGQSENGIQLYPPIPSLLEEAPEYSDGQLHAIISRGIRYTGMPSFAKALPPDQIWKIILWVRHLSQPSGPGAAAPDTSGGDQNP